LLTPYSSPKQKQAIKELDHVLHGGNLKAEVDTLIFDYGNTLVLDPFHEILRTKSKDFQRLQSVRGFGRRWQQIARLWAKANEEINLPFISHFYQDEVIVRYMLVMAGANDKTIMHTSRELLQTYRQGFKEVLVGDKRRTEVKETLGFLKNRDLKLAVLSNERESALKLALRLYGIDNLFGLILSSERIGLEKPNVKVFHQALRILDSRPETAIYVGDDPATDILPAKKVGMTTVLYIPPTKYSVKTSWRKYEYSRIHPDFVVKRFAQLRQLICRRE